MKIISCVPTEEGMVNEHFFRFETIKELSIEQRNFYILYSRALVYMLKIS